MDNARACEAGCTGDEDFHKFLFTAETLRTQRKAFKSPRTLRLRGSILSHQHFEQSKRFIQLVTAIKILHQILAGIQPHLFDDIYIL